MENFSFIIDFPIQTSIDGFSHDFPMIFPWFSHDFLQKNLWFPSHQGIQRHGTKRTVLANQLSRTKLSTASLMWRQRLLHEHRSLEKPEHFPRHQTYET